MLELGLPRLSALGGDFYKLTQKEIKDALLSRRE